MEKLSENKMRPNHDLAEVLAILSSVNDVGVVGGDDPHWDELDDMLNISPEKERIMMNATSDEDQNGYVPLSEDYGDDGYYSFMSSSGEVPAMCSIVEPVRQFSSSMTLVNTLIELLQKPFFLYARDFHAKVHFNLPDSEMAKELCRRWSKLSDDEKAKYEKKAEKNKAKYAKHMAELKGVF